MQELARIIAQALVDNPEAVSVKEIGSGQTSVIELCVAKTDLGKVIGKHGRNAMAIRTIMAAAGARDKKHVVFQIIDAIPLNMPSDMTGQDPPAPHSVPLASAWPASDPHAPVLNFGTGGAAETVEDGQ